MIWGMIGIGCLLSLFVAWAICRAGALADQNIERLRQLNDDMMKEYYEVDYRK